MRWAGGGKHRLLEGASGLDVAIAAGLVATCFRGALRKTTRLNPGTIFDNGYCQLPEAPSNPKNEYLSPLPKARGDIFYCANRMIYLSCILSCSKLRRLIAESRLNASQVPVCRRVRIVRVFSRMCISTKHF